MKIIFSALHACCTAPQATAMVQCEKCDGGGGGRWGNGGGCNGGGRWIGLFKNSVIPFSHCMI